MSEVERAEVPQPAGGRAVEGALPKALGAVWWILRFLLALFLFVGALQVMKMGAASLSVLNNQGFLVHNAASTFGLAVRRHRVFVGNVDFGTPDPCMHAAQADRAGVGARPRRRAGQA